MSEQIETAAQREALARVLFEAHGWSWDHADAANRDAWRIAAERALAWFTARPDAPVAAGAAVTRGVDLIANERRRQVEVEGWTPEHDAEHGAEALLDAARAYLTRPERRPEGRTPWEWPWRYEDWKPSPDDRVRELVKAGALIAATIDSLTVVDGPTEDGA